LSPAELEALLAGLLRLWQVEAKLQTSRSAREVRACVEVSTHPVLTVIWQHPPFGIVWQVAEEGKRQRSYPSVLGMIRHLRASLAPERGASRVLFAANGERG
jgi:hypothetical protein